LLHVMAKDKATNKEQSIRITASSGLSKEEVDKMKQDATAHAADDRKKKEEIEIRNQADNLVFQTRKHLGEFGDKVPPDQKAKVEKSAEELDAAVKSGVTSEIKAKMDALNAVWSEASSTMYQSATAGAKGASGGGPQGGPDQGAQAGPGPTDKKDEKVVEDASFEVMDDKDKEK